MPTRGSSSTVRPTPTCQTTSWPCSSHSPTTRPPTGNPWPCGRSSTPSATSAAPTHKCSPHPEISGRTPPITRHRQTPRRSRRTRTRHRRRQPQPAKPTRPTHTRRKRHPRPQQRPYPPTDPWIPHHRRGPTFRTRASTWRVADQSRHEETSAHPRQRAEGRLPHHPTAQSQSVADHARTG